MKLYEIDSKIENLIDLETGEVADFEAFESLQMERIEKIEGIILWHKNLISDAEQLKAEEKAFADRRKACENKAESLKNYLEFALQGEPFKTTKANVTYRKSESVEILDLSKLHSDYLKPFVPVADKAMIKIAIKAGDVVEGAELITRQSIQIK